MPRPLLALVPLVAATALLAPPAAAQGVSGAWEITFAMGGPRGGGERTVVFTFEQDGTRLTGSAEMAMRGRGGGGGTRTVEISDGTVEDGRISFALRLGGPRRSFTMSFAGAVDGDRMEGTVTNPRGGESPFAGRRTEG